MAAIAHTTALDGGYQLSEMRTLVLDQPGCVTNLTLSHTHFVFADTEADGAAFRPELLLARDVKPGVHRVLCYGEPSSPPQPPPLPVRVSGVDTLVMRQKRAFFLTSPYVLVNGVVASPYMGAHPAVSAWQHAVLSRVRSIAPETPLTQVFVTFFTVPFLLLNAVVSAIL